jgi:predicted HNH restriction endonuclease
MTETHTIENLHEAFREFLMEKFESSGADIQSILQIVEEEMPTLLREYFGATYQSIYELTDTTAIDEYRKKIKADPMLKSREMSMEIRYTEALKWYRLFVKKQNSVSGPLKVPGEGEPDVTAQSTRVLTTIYLEGEAGERQDKETRRRNQELRQACIRYFKALHGGRLVCECCGFSFSERYDIDDEYIEVHHRTPFSQTEGEHPVDAVKDLVPLCANCHRMIHHGQGGNGNCMSLDDLIKKLK